MLPHMHILASWEIKFNGLPVRKFVIMLQWLWNINLHVKSESFFFDSNLIKDYPFRMTWRNWIGTKNIELMPRNNIAIVVVSVTGTYEWYNVILAYRKYFQQILNN